MPRVLTQAQRPGSRATNDVVTLVVAAVLFGVCLMVVAPSLQVPAAVDRLSIRNPHPWSITVEVTNAHRDGWLRLGVAEPESTRAFEAVMDQGDTWIARLGYAGHEVDVRLARADLEQSDWTVSVPDELARRLRGAGVPESPR